MRLEDVCETFVALGFPAHGGDAPPDRDCVVRARSTVATAFVGDEFVVDCIAHELDVVESSRRRPGLLPFYAIPDLGIRFSFGYWPPGAVPGAHEHTAWTITAVCRNELEIVTFDRAESYRRRSLVRKRQFPATAGQVGFIYEPAIHAPQNSSRDWTLSFHITSPRDGEPVECVEPLLPGLPPAVTQPSGHPYVEVLKARERHAKVRLLVRTLLSARGVAVTNLLARCLRLASSRTRQMIHHARPTEFPSDVTRWLLGRTDNNLELELRSDGEGWAVYAMAPRGAAKVIAVNEVARDAVAFALANPCFDVQSLPGSLSAEERTAVGDMLEETGVFRRVEE